MSTCDVTTVNQAARHGNLSKLKKLIHNGHPLDVLDNQGWSALHEAANYNHVSCLKYLLQNFKILNERINQKAHDGCTALMLATREGNILCMQILLENHANVNLANSFGDAPLHAAIISKNIEAVNLLIKHNCDLNIMRFFDEFYPLHCCIDVDWPEGLEYILEAGALPHCYDMHHMTPIFMAAQRGNEICLKILLKNITLKDSKLLGNQLVTDVATYSNLFDIPACDFATPLFIASQYGYTKCVQILVDAGADANIMTKEPVSLPLHAAVEFNHYDCFDILLPRTNLCDLSKCDVNLLKLSIRRDNDQILFEKLIDLNKPKQLGAYNIKMTCRLHYYYPETLAEFDTKVNFNEEISILTYIVLHDANLSHGEYLLSHNFKVNERHVHNLFTPLHAAVLRRNKDWLEFLLLNGGDLNQYQLNAGGNIFLLMSIFDLPFFYLLLQYGAEADSLLSFNKKEEDLLCLDNYLLPIQFVSDKDHMSKLYKLISTFTSATTFPHPMPSLTSPRSLLHLSRVVIRRQIPAHNFQAKLVFLQHILPKILIDYLLFSDFNIVI